VLMRNALCYVLVIGLNVGYRSNLALADLPPNPTLSPNAPEDRPTRITSEELKTAIIPYIKQGQATYPAAKKRFLAGLPTGQHFFVVTKLQDSSGSSEQVFIFVAMIEDGRITGRIDNDLISVKGFKNGDPYTFPESEVVDWLITRPDGSEEGNVVGKFLDEWNKTHPSQ
jgi:Uncharacterized protein conserved in bacteria (DUF2314)